ncbi:MAG TPA: NADPH:quinone oxidoreductase family protein [Caulobacterales bacterium]|nr:NADPH:quinone oxidoreductase family protein [Caulobacterales bacterium]
MRAFQCTEITQDLSGAAVREIKTPSPRPGEVLVKIQAASVNFPDILQCQGLYQHKPPLPFVPGMEMAGTVEAIGEGVTNLQPGDEVMGGARPGGFAEYGIMNAQMARKKPEKLTLAEAAAYPTAYLTAYVALVRRARMEAGETLLVHGAAGGVGLAAVDLGKQMGAKVIATASTQPKRDFLETYGADLVLAPSGFREAVKDFTGGKGANVIYDPVGGDVFDESVRCIAFDGRLLSIGFTSGRIPEISVNMPLIKGFSVMGVRAGEYGRQFPQKGRENREAISKMAAEGKLRPHIYAEVPLADTRKAFDMLSNRDVIGKVIVRPDL